MVVIAAVEPNSGSGTVVTKARELADALDEDLHVVHVNNQYESTERIRRSSQANPGEAVDTENSKREAKAEAEQIGSEGAESFTAVGLVGYPGQEILSYADDANASYLVLGGRRRSPVGKALFGSIAQEVILGAEQPVVSIRTDSKNTDASQ